VWFGKIEAVELIFRNLTGKNRATGTLSTSKNNGKSPIYSWLYHGKYQRSLYFYGHVIMFQFAKNVGLPEGNF